MPITTSMGKRSDRACSASLTGSPGRQQPAARMAGAKLTRAISSAYSPNAPQQARRRPVHEPEQPSLGGADGLRGESVRLIVALQDCP